MEKTDLILDKLTAMERALKAENKATHDKIDAFRDENKAMERALKAENKAIHDKIDNLGTELSKRLDMAWQAVRELRDDKSELNELRKRIEALEKNNINVTST